MKPLDCESQDHAQNELITLEQKSNHTDIYLPIVVWSNNSTQTNLVNGPINDWPKDGSCNGLYQFVFSHALYNTYFNCHYMECNVI